jgi:succinyldiaminopimelate transaminase
VPDAVRQALADAANAPGYPATAGTPRLRAAIVGYVSRRCGARLGEESVLPTIGSKELVASLPSQLGVGPGDVVVIPTICYPTYEVGARLAGATVVRADAPAEVPAATGPVRLVWVNSPANPHGRVLSADALREWVSWARAQGAVLASDECYLELGFDASPTSVLSVCDGTYDGVLAVHSLSKRSNLAGYRAAFVAGDRALVTELLAVRKHSGLIMPGPVQAAMAAALDDQAHADAQRAVYRARRSALWSALAAAGFTIDHSQAGLYLWATRGEECWSTVDWFAERGILVAPGVFYGPTADKHVRIALTATDERIAAAVARLS